MPELKTIRSSLTPKPNIEVYEGITGLKSIFNDILKEKQETWFIGAPEMLNSLKFYFPFFINQKRKLGMFSKVITQNCKEMRQYKQDSPEKYINVRFTDKKIEMTKIIYRDKVAFLTFKEKDSIGILIENKQIAETEKNMFEILWESLE